MIDATELCLDDDHPHRRGHPIGVGVHRFGIEGVHDAAGAARFCRGEPSLGRKMAYGRVIQPDGQVELALPDDRFGWNCLRHSRGLLAVALLGDFRRHPPTMAQWLALEDTCIDLMDRYWLPVWSVRGHDEIPGGSNDPNRRCPGRHLPMDGLRGILSLRR